MNIAQASIFRKQWVRAVIALMITIVFLSLTFIPFMSQKSSTEVAGTVNPNISPVSMVGKADASMLAYGCRGLGYNMNDPANWGQDFVNTSLDDKSNRLFTIHQAFGNSLRFVLYYGEGEGENFIAAKEEAPPEFVTVDPGKLENERTIESCLINRIPTSLSNVGFWASDSIVLISQFIVGLAFSPNLVCDPDSNSTDSCLDLVSIIGGESDSDDNSILASLTNSVYFPLLAIAAMITGVLVFYQGVVKRQIRQAFFGLGYCLVVTILGAAMLLNPTLLTKAPMTIASTASSCILGAFGGENCVGESVEGIDVTDPSITGSSTSDSVCRSNVASANFSEKMQASVDASMCQIWKAFVLEPYSVASFGLPFSELDTMDASAKGSEFVAASSASPNDFCVNLGSTQSAGSMRNETLNLNSSQGRVCNIAAYQLYLMTNAESNGDTLPSPGEIDERWYKIIEVAGNNDSMWSAWTSNSMGKLSGAFLSIMVSLAGAAILLVTGLFALVYYVSGIILMAFAPIFLLVGIHPGRGKRMMLGWLEKIISNVLKYIISAAFVVVTIAIYGGVLSTNSNLGITVIFVFIVSVALFMYRREFIEMLGRANMGGEQISNSMSESLANMSRKGVESGRSLAVSGVGGAVGARMAGGSAMGGFNQGVKRNLKMGFGVTANAAREYDNVKMDNREKLEKQVARRDNIQDFNSRERFSDSMDYARENLSEFGSVNPNASREGLDPNASREGHDQVNTNGRRVNSEGLDQINANKRRVNSANDRKSQWDDFELELRDVNLGLVNNGELVDGLADIIQVENPEMDREESVVQAQNAIDVFTTGKNLDIEKAKLDGQIAFDKRNGIDYSDKLERLAEINEAKSEVNTNLPSNISSIISNESVKAMNDVNNDIVSPHLTGEKIELDTLTGTMESSELQQFNSFKAKKSEILDLENEVNYSSSIGNVSAENDARMRLEEAHSDLGQMTSTIKSNDDDVSRAVELDEKISQGTTNPLKEFARESYRHEKVMSTVDIDLNNGEESTPLPNSSNDDVSRGVEFEEKIPQGRPLPKSSNDDGSSSKTPRSEIDDYAEKLPQRPKTKQQLEQETIRQERERKMDIEAANAESMLEGLHPGSGVTRRNIKKARKKAGEQLSNEGFIGDGKKDIRSYARERSRNDVRGVNLDKDWTKFKPNNKK